MHTSNANNLRHRDCCGADIMVTNVHSRQLHTYSCIYNCVVYKRRAFTSCRCRINALYNGYHVLMRIYRLIDVTKQAFYCDKNIACTNGACNLTALWLLSLRTSYRTDFQRKHLKKGVVMDTKSYPVTYLVKVGVLIRVMVRNMVRISARTGVRVS